MPTQLQLVRIVAAPSVVALAANVIVPREAHEVQLPEVQSAPSARDHYSIVLTVDVFTVIAFVVLIALAVVGGVSLYRLATQKSCACPICQKQYEIVKRLGTGGYGTVLEVRRSSDSPFNGKRRAVARRGGARARAASSDDDGPHSDGEGGHDGERFVIKMIPCATLSDASIAQQEAKCVGVDSVAWTFQT